MLQIVRRELINGTIGILRQLKRFRYLCCDITLLFLIVSAVWQFHCNNLFRKLCLPWQTVNHSLPAVWKCNNLTDYRISRFVAAEQPWPNPVDDKIWGNMSTRQKRRIWTLWGSIWLMCKLEWNRALSVMALTSDADVSMSAFEPQDDIMTIHRDIY